MTLPLSMPMLKYGGAVLCALGLAWIVYKIQTQDTILNRYYRQYTTYLNRTLKLLFMEGSGEKIFVGQLVVVLASAGAAVWFSEPYVLVVTAAAMGGPAVFLARKRQEHIRALEGQADTLILGLANALKTVPSPAAALGSLIPVLPFPMKLEIDRLMKEIRVGSTLEQALVNMSARLKSPDLDAALSSLLIGLQVGGNLPQVLETTAATIREMARLQGVVRTKTSEARAQLWVLALFPFVISYGFISLDPDYFTPLQTTFVGSLVTAVALIFWLASLLTARKVLQVDI